jgi:hypothetical protein
VTRRGKDKAQRHKGTKGETGSTSAGSVTRKKPEVKGERKTVKKNAGKKKEPTVYDK